NHPQSVGLKTGETFDGHLVNHLMNITLQEVFQFSPDTDRFWKGNTRGSTIKHIRVPDALLDAVKDEQNRAREMGRSAR
ncbi:hypothetical protein JAAARDRAFT_100130, partial [Jaapia argillacea MUCL 33604]